METGNVILSVVIPAYNCQDTIIGLLDSIAQQGIENYEVIAVNDGSRDDTLAVLNEKSKTMSELRVLDKPNEGAPKARNLGMSQARGEYIYLCDADDLVYPGALQKMLDYAEENQLDVVVANVCHKGANGEEHVYKSVVERFERLGPDKYYFSDPIPGTKLFRREFLQSKGIVFDPVRIGQDLNFYTKAVSSTDKIGWLDETVYIYQTSFSGISKTYKLETLMNIRNSIDGIVAYCKQKGFYTKEREDAIECVKMANYLWQLKKKKNMRKEDFTVLRKELCGEVDLKRVKKSKYAAYMRVTIIEFTLVKKFGLVLRNI